MSNEGKFKVGDVVVSKILSDDDGFHKRIVADISGCGTYIYFSETRYVPWCSDDFELSEPKVSPENKVPDNMEIVGYQAKFDESWCVLDEDRYVNAKSLGYNTRVLYAFKQN